MYLKHQFVPTGLQFLTILHLISDYINIRICHMTKSTDTHALFIDEAFFRHAAMRKMSYEHTLGWKQGRPPCSFKSMRYNHK